MEDDASNPVDASKSKACRPGRCNSHRWRALLPLLWAIPVPSSTKTVSVSARVTGHRALPSEWRDTKMARFQVGPSFVGRL